MFYDSLILINNVRNDYKMVVLYSAISNGQMENLIHFEDCKANKMTLFCKFCSLFKWLLEASAQPPSLEFQQHIEVRRHKLTEFENNSFRTKCYLNESKERIENLRKIYL